MRRIVAILLLLAGALPCQAQASPAKPNTLSAQEIADGWLLLFDGETTFGWRVKRGNAGKSLKVTDGVLDFGELGACDVVTSVPFGAFEMRFDYQCDTADTHFAVVSATGGPFRGVFLPRQLTWKNVGTYVKNGKMDFDVGLPNTFPMPWRDPCTFMFDQGPKTVTKLRNIKLRPLEARPLFNGKDLAGWSEYPGKRSKFTVTDRGELNVRNGPGDLQTAGTYKNFVLQLECISHGKHLNSGIFFRCQDKEYQNGYEVQIFNKFTLEATQEYTTEEYDAKTHKLLSRNKIKSTAVDYGTGAIYRRVPARKEMSRDGAWFAMTIVAHGSHFATWVNGVQVTGWTDNRPRSDNPRTGCRLEAGHISIQGHDPTTNLSFRNLRIAELK